MALQAIYETQEDVPEAFRELYTEKSGRWEVTGIAGVKTTADVERIQTVLARERADHKETKSKLAVWGDLDHEEVNEKLARFPELEEAAKGDLDKAKIEELVSQRVEATVRSKTAALQRQLDTVMGERDETAAKNVELEGEKRTRTIHDGIREQLIKQRVIPEAHEDAMTLADRVFEIREDDGAIITRDQVGVTPGVGPDVWLSEMQERRPHWWPSSSGSGAPGARNGPTGMADNPFSAAHWNMTRQGEVVRSQGMEKAQQMAKAAGTTVGGGRPAAPSS